MKRKRKLPDGSAVETDPRFPTGRWVGFWLQRHYAARQYMSLHLAFVNGTVRGFGSDVVGDFDMRGEYDLTSGACKIVKAYDGAHSLLYEGRNEGDGLWIWGLWSIRTFDRGGFHLWPHGEEDPTGRKLKREKEQPAPSRRRVRVVPPPVVEPEPVPAGRGQRMTAEGRRMKRASRPPIHPSAVILHPCPPRRGRNGPAGG